MNAGLSLQQAMRAALLADAQLTTLLGGGHVFDELPRGAKPPLVHFSTCETRDWSVADSKAHEHFCELKVETAEESRAQSQAISDRIDAVLDNAALVLTDHHLVNLRLVFWSVSRSKTEKSFGATLRFRAATEPL